MALQWRHNGRHDVSNHQPHHCLFKRLFRPKKTSKLCVTGLCAENSPVTGEFPAQMTSNAENVFVWWRHHGSTPRLCCEHLRTWCSEIGTCIPHAFHSCPGYFFLPGWLPFVGENVEYLISIHYCQLNGVSFQWFYYPIKRHSFVVAHSFVTISRRTLRKDADHKTFRME